MHLLRLSSQNHWAKKRPINKEGKRKNNHASGNACNDLTRKILLAILWISIREV